MHPISLIFLGLCAFLVGFWLVRQLERRKVKSSGPQAMMPPTPAVTDSAAQAAEAQRAIGSSDPAAVDNDSRSVPPIADADPVDTPPKSAPASNYDIRDLILADRSEEAVKLLQKRKGWNLATAQKIVAQQAQRQSPKDLDPALIAEARQLLAENRKVSAVKLIYDRTGWSLRAAKDYVENSL
ncbi:hypothetical protein [Leptolyngbya iicbica]|uniref:Ribosomal protein L7/L12 C-terminal domain-containing protein n=2 Tax=Cyanophyceae TaxID=3028117 RepID=A0A4Q7EDK5_9CYAN|nr:hypothetical protein [Leptolyngbya sp. LK]RZM79305.1 hypothetical protein DYY88_11180 [Leptolyngbya sp. LK]